MHEFFDPSGEEVFGHEFAEDFLKSYKASTGKWEVFFAILAPYWGYWESGFWMKSGGDFGEKKQGTPRTKKFMQFQVMTHVHTEIGMELKLSQRRLSVYVPEYTYKNPRWIKKFKKRKGIKHYRRGMEV